MVPKLDFMFIMLRFAPVRIPARALSACCVGFDTTAATAAPVIKAEHINPRYNFFMALSHFFLITHNYTKNSKALQSIFNKKNPPDMGGESLIAAIEIGISVLAEWIGNAGVKVKSIVSKACHGKT